MATITDVRSCTVRIPLPTTMAFATRAVQSRDFTLVTVPSDTGTTGTGFCHSGSTSGAMVSTAATELLAPVAVLIQSRSQPGLGAQNEHSHLLAISRDPGVQ